MTTLDHIIFWGLVGVILLALACGAIGIWWPRKTPDVHDEAYGDVPGPREEA